MEKIKSDFKKVFRVAAALLLLLLAPLVMAATDADVTVTYQIQYMNITDNATTVAFGAVAPGATSNTSTAYVQISNNSSIQVDAYIGVTGATWTGGTAHTHDDSATPGADTVGLLANRGGTWGTGDVIVEYGDGTYSSWQFIYENCPISTNFTYGLGLQAPTSTTDNQTKTNTVRVTIIAG